MKQQHNKPDFTGVHDFDFLHGAWHVTHHRLAGRLNGATDWHIAQGTDFIRPCFNGLGNVGCFRRLFDGQPYEGMPIRLYDPSIGLWRIYWLDHFDQRMEPPVVGEFSAGQGLFLGDDVLRGQTIKVRYTWSEITANSARWDQAYSADGGQSWEVNSIMEFTRMNPEASQKLAHSTLHSAAFTGGQS